MRTNPKPNNGTVRNVAIVKNKTLFSIFVQLALIKPITTKITSEFLYYFLQSEKGQKEIDQKSSQSTMQFIGTQKISIIKTPVPCMLEQFEVTQVLSNCDNKIDALEKEISLLDELFRAMLEELVTGRLSSMALVEGNE